MENVIIVPGLRKNLISVKQICDRGGEVNFVGETAQITKDGKVVMTATRVENKLYRLNLRNNSSMEAHNAEDQQKQISKIDLWHERLGHLSESEMKKLLRSNMMEGLDFSLDDKLSFCPVCSIGKQTREKFIATDSIRTKDIGEVIHSDVCGPINIASIGGARYFLTFVDDYSRKSWIYFLKRKSEVFERNSVHYFEPNQANQSKHCAVMVVVSTFQMSLKIGYRAKELLIQKLRLTPLSAMVLLSVSIAR